MSVLVEALAVIVRRATLDLSYPGGADQYLLDAIEAKCPPRLACTDSDLTSVCFLSPDDSRAWIKHLEPFGLIHLDASRCVDIVCIDQHDGPTMPCDWISWRVHPDGFTYCWPANQAPTDMVAPENWSPEQSRRLTRRDVCDENHMLQLAIEDGLEYWLDLSTGQQTVAVGHYSEERPVKRSDGPLMNLVRSAMASIDWTPEQVSDDFLRIQVAGKQLSFGLFVGVNEADQTILCSGTFPVFAEPSRRMAVAEAMTRINFGLVIGSLELDFADGEMRYRHACDVEHCTPTEEMVHAMFGTVCALMDRCGAPLMRVALSAASPEDAAREALENAEP
jgi:hypothetical protein